MDQHHSSPRSSLFTGAPPKLTFLFGIVAGIAATALLALFLILPKAYGSGTTKQAATAAADDTVAAPDALPTPPPQPSGSIQVAAVTDQDHVRGNAKAPITVIEFSDLECPFCKRVHPTMQQLLTQYQDKVRWVYRHFPLDSLHPKARKEAEATECANELGGNDAFWKYVDRLFEVTPSNDGLDPAQLPQIAEDVGLNRKKFESCLSSGKYAQHVADDLAQANAAGGNGTPYSVVVAGDQKIPVSGAVPISQFQAVIDPLLK